MLSDRIQEKTASTHATRLYRKDGKSPKKYEYKVKYLTELGLDDFADIIGIENTCKLFVLLANISVKFPALQITKSRLRQAIIRNEIRTMEDKGEKKIAEKLGEKYKLNKGTIKMIRGDNVQHPKRQVQWNMRMHALRIRDERVLEIMKEHWDVLEKYGLV